jgi:hypothetical protein
MQVAYLAVLVATLAGIGGASYYVAARLFAGRR